MELQALTNAFLALLCWCLLVASGNGVQAINGTDSFYHRTAYSRGRWLRQHVNNLPALLKFAALGNTVVATTVNRAYREFAANWHYSITRFGNVKEVLMVAFDEESLSACLSLNLVCYNGSSLAALPSDIGTSTDVTHGNPKFNRLLWARVHFFNDIVQHNYTLINSDTDTVWLKDAVRSMEMGANEHDADMVGMNDQNSGNPNAGNLYLRNNIRTRALLKAWVEVGYSNGQIKSDIHDQQGLWLLKGKFWEWCKTGAECAAVKAKGLAALWLHPWHGCPWEHFEYAKVKNVWENGICSANLAYLHIFCTAGGIPHKKDMASKVGVWFVDPVAQTPLYHNAAAIDLVKILPEHLVKDSPKLPCDNEVAWQGL